MQSHSTWQSPPWNSRKKPSTNGAQDARNTIRSTTAVTDSRRLFARLLRSAKKEWPDSKWYPVEEKLPEIHKDVLVTDREVSDVYVSYYCGGGYWGTDTGGANNRIIAWMPLPEPYQEDET